MENIDRDGTRLTELAVRAGMSHPATLDLVRAWGRPATSTGGPTRPTRVPGWCG